MMTNADIAQWLELHIPSRFRAALAHTNDKITGGCVLDLYAQDAVQLGRLIAIRWLIEFVGIQAKGPDGKPTEFKPRTPYDTRIDKLRGVLLSDASFEAHTLAKVWNATSKAVSHPTHASGHDDIGLEVILEAVAILKKHIQKNLYDAHGEDLELRIGAAC